MKILEYFQEIPKLFNWYFQLQAIKRIQLNYIILIAFIITVGYYNDKRHTEINAKLSAGIVASNDARTRDQEKYTAKLVYYTDKFYYLLERSNQQKEKQQELNTSEK